MGGTATTPSEVGKVAEDRVFGKESGLKWVVCKIADDGRKWVQELEDL